LNLSRSTSIKIRKEASLLDFFLFRKTAMSHLPELGKTAAGEHGFETNNREGRLILRSIQPEEIQINHNIRSDPQNNQFNAYPDCEIGVDKLEQVLTPKWRHDVPILQLFVILKAKKGYWPQKLVAKRGPWSESSRLTWLQAKTQIITALPWLG
jgi:hypothetical protein